MISEAVAREKRLAYVSLHPSDPVELLFWGPEDDMSLLRFALAFRERFRIALGHDEMMHFLSESFTVSQVVAYCAARVEKPRSLSE